MRNNKILKGIILIITIVLIACMSTIVYADNILDLDSTLNGGNNTTGNNTDGNNTTGNNVTGNSTVGNNTTGNNVTGNSTVGNNTTGNSTINSANGNNTTGNNTTGNTSTYEESDIPYAGPEDTILMVSAFIVCGIIGIYTFIKLSDYSNI